MVAYAVVMRYVFNSAPTWVDDSVGFILVGIVMLGAATTLRQGGHINVDMLTERLGGHVQLGLIPPITVASSALPSCTASAWI